MNNSFKLRLRYTEAEWAIFYAEAAEMKISIGMYIHHKIMKEYGSVSKCAPCHGIAIDKIEKSHEIDIPKFVSDKILCKSYDTGISFSALISLAIKGKKID